MSENFFSAKTCSETWVYVRSTFIFSVQREDLLTSSHVNYFEKT